MNPDNPKQKSAHQNSARWNTIGETLLAQSPVMDVIARQCVSSDHGRELTFYLMKSREWCNIIPVTEDGKIVLVRQFRIGIEQHTTEIPGGIADEGDQDLKSAAIREMIEETGYEPLPQAQCVDLGWSHSNPATFNNRTHGFVIGPVRKAKQQNLDPGEMIDVLEVEISEIPRLIQERVISHSLMINTFFFLALKDPSVSEALTRGLRRFAGSRGA